VRARVYMAAFGCLDARGAVIARTDEKLQGVNTWEVAWLDDVAATDAAIDDVDVRPSNAQPLPRPRPSKTRRRSEDARDEMRMFDSQAPREPPPSYRGASGRVTHVREQTGTASQEPDHPSCDILEGRARGGSLAEEPSVCWLPMWSSSAPGASEAGPAHARGANLSA
jgi:hypothetical protein